MYCHLKSSSVLPHPCLPLPALALSLLCHCSFMWRCSCCQRQHSEHSTLKTYSFLSSFLLFSCSFKIISLFNILNCPELNLPHPHQLTVFFKFEVWFMHLIGWQYIRSSVEYINYFCLPVSLYICERVSEQPVPWLLLSVSDPRCGTMRQGTLSEPWRVTQTLYKTSLLTRQESCWLHVQLIWASSCGTFRGLSASERCMVRTDVNSNNCT